MARVALSGQNGTHRTSEIRPQSHHLTGPQNESPKGKDSAQPATHRWKDSGHPETLPSKAHIGNAHHPPNPPHQTSSGTGPEQALEAITTNPSRTARKQRSPPSLPASAGPFPRPTTPKHVAKAAAGTGRSKHWKRSPKPLAHSAKATPSPELTCARRTVPAAPHPDTCQKKSRFQRVQSSPTSAASLP